MSSSTDILLTKKQDKATGTAARRRLAGGPLSGEYWEKELLLSKPKWLERTRRDTSVNGLRNNRRKDLQAEDEVKARSRSRLTSKQQRDDMSRIQTAKTRPVARNIAKLIGVMPRHITAFRRFWARLRERESQSATQKYGQGIRRTELGNALQRRLRATFPSIHRQYRVPRSVRRDELERLVSQENGQSVKAEFQRVPGSRAPWVQIAQRLKRRGGSALRRTSITTTPNEEHLRGTTKSTFFSGTTLQNATADPGSVDALAGQAFGFQKNILSLVSSLNRVQGSGQTVVSIWVLGFNIKIPINTRSIDL
ncbi:hypothetical protein BDZ89DRAFT_1036919 [Hymenopellis radicata]|nr:hypothetical protein BDZ89DRAFT_1036919 [Hymenopellis radicata]